jgi:hypothetical protein
MVMSKGFKAGVKEAKTGKSGSKMHEKGESKSFKKQEAKGEASVKKSKK